VDEEARRVAGTVAAVGSLTVSAPQFANFPNNYFAFGRLTFGGEMRLIVAHTGATLTLNAAFRATLQAGASVVAVPGCDKLLATCAAKFGNAVNFGGFPFVPLKNPQLKALNAPKTGGGGKK
jgi:uncharacterized phage protein (TIGR02218 family)